MEEVESSTLMEMFTKASGSMTRCTEEVLTSTWMEPGTQESGMKINKMVME